MHANARLACKCKSATWKSWKITWPCWWPSGPTWPARRRSSRWPAAWVWGRSRRASICAWKQRQPPIRGDETMRVLNASADRTRHALTRDAVAASLRPIRRRTLLTLAVLFACFVAVAVQLLRLGLRAEADMHLNLAEPIGQSWSRPDIVDRHGQLLATDVASHSLYADPQLVLDLDEVVEKVTGVLSSLDHAEVRRALADRSRRFAWIARGLTPRQAQLIHDLGLPGLAFRTELKRVYPLGLLAGHVLAPSTSTTRA